MFSLAIQIKALPEQSIKRIRMSAGIQLTTLRHHSTLPQHSWLTQLQDMFDVVDYPVQGYTPLGVITEMHLHLWDCAIDYRPLYFPYRAVITVSSFMISSNIAAECTGLTLRFIAEDATLSLAPQIVPVAGSDEPKKGTKEDNKVRKIDVRRSESCQSVCLCDVYFWQLLGFLPFYFLPFHVFCRSTYFFRIHFLPFLNFAIDASGQTTFSDE